MQIFRVIVRGRFGPLEPARRAALLDEADQHDVVRAGVSFTPTGRLSYDGRVDAFSVRVEVRVDDDRPGAAREAAFAEAIDVATALLERRLLPWRDLRATGSNMADVWAGPRAT